MQHPSWSMRTIAYVQRLGCIAPNARLRIRRLCYISSAASDRYYDARNDGRYGTSSAMNGSSELGRPMVSKCAFPPKHQNQLLTGNGQITRSETSGFSIVACTVPLVRSQRIISLMPLDQSSIYKGHIHWSFLFLNRTLNHVLDAFARKLSVIG